MCSRYLFILERALVFFGVPVLHTESPAAFTGHVAQHEPGLTFGMMAPLHICDHVGVCLLGGCSGCIKCGGKIEWLIINVHGSRTFGRFRRSNGTDMRRMECCIHGYWRLSALFRLVFLALCLGELEGSFFINSERT
jgi:hydrogenase/urease accessory protein HupE